MIATLTGHLATHGSAPSTGSRPGRRMPSSRNFSCKLCRCKPIVAAVFDTFHRWLVNCFVKYATSNLCLASRKSFSPSPTSEPFSSGRPTSASPAATSSGKSVTPISSPRQSTRLRSSAFLSSRAFPGQSYRSIAARASRLSLAVRPNREPCICKKLSASTEISSLCSRSAGSSMVTTRSR